MSSLNSGFQILVCQRPNLQIMILTSEPGKNLIFNCQSQVIIIFSDHNEILTVPDMGTGDGGNILQWSRSPCKRLWDGKFGRVKNVFAILFMLQHLSKNYQFQHVLTNFSK
jgi:hypothetical protein